MFQGFAPEAVDFLWGIRMNNNREWFMANKPQYVQQVYEPMKALGQALFEPFLDKPGNVLKVSRIYRDARLHHPLPYKESLWICIRRDVEWWGDNPCLYFEINPEGIDYGFFFWKPRPAFMKEFRKRIDAKPEEFLKMVAGVEKSTGVPITAVQYKHPAPWEDPRLERFHLWKEQIACAVHEDFGPDVFSSELADRVRDFFQKLVPLYDFFDSFT